MEVSILSLLKEVYILKVADFARATDDGYSSEEIL
jgi:hypothetical protein